MCECACVCMYVSLNVLSCLYEKVLRALCLSSSLTILLTRDEPLLYISPHKSQVSRYHVSHSSTWTTNWLLRNPSKIWKSNSEVSLIRDNNYTKYFKIWCKHWSTENVLRYVHLFCTARRSIHSMYKHMSQLTWAPVLPLCKGHAGRTLIYYLLRFAQFYLASHKCKLRHISSRENVHSCLEWLFIHWCDRTLM